MNPFTSAAIRTGSRDASNREIGAAALIPFVTLCQNVSISSPLGVISPIPVTTDRFTGSTWREYLTAIRIPSGNYIRNSKSEIRMAMRLPCFHIFRDRGTNSFEFRISNFEFPPRFQSVFSNSYQKSVPFPIPAATQAASSQADGRANAAPIPRHPARD